MDHKMVTTTTLKIGSRPITVGIISDVQFDGEQRAENIDIPSARGSSRQDLGALSAPIDLTGALTDEDTRDDDFDQLQRYRLKGQSVHLTAPNLETVAFIDRVSPSKIWANMIEYKMRLTESLFKSLNACEDLVGMVSDGSLVLGSDNPLPKEGDYYVQASRTNTGVYIMVNFSEAIDLSNFDYIAAWIAAGRITNLTSAQIYVLDDTNQAYAEIKDLLTEADVFKKAILHKTEFTGYESLDWGAVAAVVIQLYYSGSYPLTVMLDDLGAFE